MYNIRVKPSLDRKFRKISLKNKKLMESISKKIEEIIQNPQHYKNLRNPLQMWKRVHVGKSFVLCFSVDEKSKVVTLEKFGHHDEIYR